MRTIAVFGSYLLVFPRNEMHTFIRFYILLLTVENHQVSLATPGDFLHIHSVSRESQRVTTHVLKLHATTD